MKYLIVISALAFLAFVFGDTPKDPGQIAADCKVKYPITDAEEQDIKNKTFKSTSPNSRKFFDCFICGTGFADAKTGDLVRSAFVATAGNDAALITKIDTCLKNCTSKSTDKITKEWELASCYFSKMNSLMNSS